MKARTSWDLPWPFGSPSHSPGKGLSGLKMNQDESDTGYCPPRLEECLFPHHFKLPRDTLHNLDGPWLRFPLILVINSLTCTEHMPNPCPRHKNGFY